MKVGISERITGEAAGEAKPQSANNYERAEGPRPASEEVAGAMEVMLRGVHNRRSVEV